MRILISSLIILVSALTSFGQRVAFEDPDLTFSFKKPKHWELFDDGLVVKISPSKRDSASIYMTLTYYEDAIPIDGQENALLVKPNEAAEAIPELPTSNEVKIGKYMLKTGSKQTLIDGESYLYQRYVFKNYEQRWEIITSRPEEEQEQYSKVFQRVIKSLKITTNN